MTEYPNPAEGSRVHTEFYDTRREQIDATVLGWRVGAGQRPSDEYLAWNGFYGVVRTTKPTVNPRTHRVAAVAPRLWTLNEVAKTVTETWQVQALTDQEVTQMTADATAAVRAQRNALLAASDFRQLPDAPGNKTAWATYRQALRDITAGMDPFNPVWPTPPTE